MRRARGDKPPAAFDFGPEREAYEAVWTPALQDAILAATFDYPHRLRHFLRGRLFAHLDARIAAGQVITPEEIVPLVAEIQHRELGTHGQ